MTFPALVERGRVYFKVVRAYYTKSAGNRVKGPFLGRTARKSLSSTVKIRLIPKRSRLQ